MNICTFKIKLIFINGKIDLTEEGNFDKLFFISFFEVLRQEFSLASHLVERYDGSVNCLFEKDHFLTV